MSAIVKNVYHSFWKAKVTQKFIFYFSIVRQEEHNTFNLQWLRGGEKKQIFSIDTLELEDVWCFYLEQIKSINWL